MSETTKDEQKPFEFFELVVAILLGIAAVSAAWSSYQSSLWNGKSVEAYGEAATLGTRASTEHDRAEMDIAHDFECDLQGKEKILEALDASSAAEKTRFTHLASYLYSVEMSTAAYAQMNLPSDYHTAGDIKKHEGIPLEVLKETLERRLGPAYEDAMLAKAREGYTQSDRRFDDGRQASSLGDRFDLNTVIFTVSLFFAGLGLVFKTRIRWYFVMAGFLVFLSGAVQLIRSPWA
jgi:hypothetical protein